MSNGSISLSHSTSQKLLFLNLTFQLLFFSTFYRKIVLCNSNWKWKIQLKKKKLLQLLNPNAIIIHTIILAIANEF